MTRVDQIAAATGLAQILNRQQVKQGGLVKEPALTAKSARVPSDAPAVVKDPELAGKALGTSIEALKGASDSLAKALGAARQALDAPPEQREALAKEFNALVKQTQDFADQAKPMVFPTAQGGQITVPKSGIDVLGKASWLNREAIQSSVNELQNAYITLSTTQTQYASAQYALAIAAELERSSELTDSRSVAERATAVILAADHAEWTAEAKRTVAEEANREAALREAYGRQRELE